MAELSFDVMGNSTSFINEVEQMCVVIQKLSFEFQNVEKENDKLSFSFKKVWKSIDGTTMLKNFVGNIIKVRGEFQQFETSFATLLQDKNKADVLMSQMMEMTTRSPFSVTELAKGAEQLLSYGMGAEEVNNTLSQLGDIASGVGVPLENLTSLYGTVMLQGTLCADDLDKFTNSGIPMLQGLADIYGVNTEKLREMVSAGQVGFPEIQKVMENLTNAGGQFYNMMNVQSDTIQGKINNLGDAWDMMLNKIGQSQEGVVNDSLDGIQFLIENYEQIGKILLSLIETYGVYRAACIAHMVLTQSLATTQLELGAVLLKLKKSFSALMATMNLNPWVLATTVVIGLAVAMWNLADHTSAAERAQERYNEKVKKTNEQEQERKRHLEELVSELQNEYTAEARRQEIINEIKQDYPAFFKFLLDEKGNVNDLTEAWRAHNEETSKNKVLQNKDNVSSLKAKIAEEKRFLELFDMDLSDRQKNIKGSSADANIWKTYQGKGTYNIKRQLEESEKELLLAEKDVRNDEFVRWQVDLKDKTDRQIDAIRSALVRRAQAAQGNKYLVAALNKRVSAIDDEKQSRKPQTENKNESYWNKQRETAEKALKAIGSSERRLLESGNFKKVDASVVENYKKQKRLLQEAQNELSVYSDANGTSEQDKQFREMQVHLQELIEKQTEEQERAKKDSINELTQLEIDQLQEGSDKVLKQRELNYKKEIEAIKREAEDKKKKLIEDAKALFYADPQNSGEDFNTNTFINSEQGKEQIGRVNNVRDMKINTSNVRYKRGDDLKDLLDKYQDYTDGRLAIEEKFNTDIATLEGQRKIALENGDAKQVEQLDLAKAKATKDKGMELMNFDYEQLKQTPEYIRAFENLKYTSSETLNSLLGKLESSKQAASKVLDPEQLREYTTTIQEIMDELDERNPFQSLVDKKEDLALAENELSNAQVQLENARRQAEDVKNGKQVENGVSTKYNPKTGKIDSTKVYLSEAQALNKVKEKTDKYNRAKDNVVEKAEKVKIAEEKTKDVIDNLSKSISNLGASIGGPYGEIISLVGDIGSFTMMAMSGVEVASKTAATSIQTVEKASVILAVIGAAVQIAMKIASLFNKDAKKEKNIEKIQDQIDVLKRSYDDLGEAADKAYSADASELIDQQNELLKQQKVLIQNQILEEKSKKKTDDRRVKDLENQLEDIDKLIGENKEKQLDAIMGSDLKSAIDEFAQAYADAWSAGNDRAKSSKDLVKDMIKQMIMESLKAASSKPMEELRQKLADYYKDGIISAWEREQIEKDAEAITKELDSKYGWADEYLKGEEESTSQADSSKGGFETMSQETGSELNGRFTALQISNEEIKNSMLLVLGNLSSLCTTASDGNILLTEMRNLAVMSNGHLEDIAKHTKVLLGFGDKLDRIEQNTGRL